MHDWPTTLLEEVTRNGQCVLVTVAEIRGSTPREAGAKMIVGRFGQIGSIGGGALEFQTVEKARQILAGPNHSTWQLERVPLGPGIGQCCGGDVRLLYEPVGINDIEWIKECINVRMSEQSGILISEIDENGISKTVLPSCDGVFTTGFNPTVTQAAEQVSQHRKLVQLVKVDKPARQLFLVETLADRRTDLWLYGAGHVGLALANVVANTPFRVRLLDTRPDAFPANISFAGNVDDCVCMAPTDEVGFAPPGTYFLVMTHSHPLDLALCEAVMRREDFGYLGLIGSETKKARFIKRLREGGIASEEISRLICPIGIDGVPGKSPEEIAISVAADLLRHVASS